MKASGAKAMEVNFAITENYALNFEGRHIDLHNNFDLAGFEYKPTDRQLKISWIRSDGNWVPTDEFVALTLTHKTVTYLVITEADEDGDAGNATCLSEVTFFPSSHRDINDNIIDQVKPSFGDDILYIFENGRTIRVHCEQIMLAVS